MFKLIKKMMIASLVILLNTGFAVAEESLRFVTSPTASGTWYIGMGAIGKVLTDAFSQYDVTLIPGGGATNVPRLIRGDADVGIATHCVAMASLKGLPPYKVAAPEGASSIFNLWDRANYQIIALESSGITDLSDLKNKKNLRIAVGASGGTTEVLCRIILEYYGISYDDIRRNGGRILTNSFDDVANMAKDGQIDLFCWLGPGEAWFVVEVASSTDLRWISIDQEIAEKVQARLGIKIGELPANYYDNRVGKGVTVLWDAAEIIVRSDLSEQTVYDLTKVISESKEDISRANATWKSIDPKKAWKNLAYPIHPGAAKYFKEMGYMP